MNLVLEFIIISSIYVVIASLLILLVRIFMQKLGSSTITIYKLWWVFLVGFAVLIVLQFYNPEIKMTSGLTQTIDMPTAYISYNKGLDSQWNNSLILAMIFVSLVLFSRLILKYFSLKKGLLFNSIVKPRLIETPFIKSPVAFGVFKSNVYVPIDFETNYTELQQALLLDHELVHCHRYDPLMLVLYRILMALFWFHPAIYLLNYCMKKDQESSCDEIVMNKSKQPSEYSKLLLQLNQLGSKYSKKPELYCSSSSMLKERIMLIKNLQPKSFINKVLSKSLLLISTAGLLITTTVLADMVQVAKNEQSFTIVPKPPSPDISPILAPAFVQVKDPDPVQVEVPSPVQVKAPVHVPDRVPVGIIDKSKVEHVAIQVPHPDATTKYVGLLKPITPKSPTPQKSPSIENIPINKLVAISTPRPNYPRAAAVKKLSGYVVVEFDVLTDGSVKNPKVIDSQPKRIFNREALKSIAKYKFEPLLEKLRIRRRVEFSMN